MCSKPQIKTDGWGDYSFQFWMVPEVVGYRADGAYGQLTIIMPHHGYVFSLHRPVDENLPKVIEILKEEVFNKL